MLNKLDKFHKTASGYVVFGLVELVASYLLIRVAFDTGTLLYYLFFLVFFIGAITNIFKLVGQILNVKTGRSK